MGRRAKTCISKWEDIHIMDYITRSNKFKGTIDTTSNELPAWNMFLIYILLLEIDYFSYDEDSRVIQQN